MTMDKLIKYHSKTSKKLEPEGRSRIAWPKRGEPPNVK